MRSIRGFRSPRLLRAVLSVRPGRSATATEARRGEFRVTFARMPIGGVFYPNAPHLANISGNYRTNNHLSKSTRLFSSALLDKVAQTPGTVWEFTELDKAPFLRLCHPGVIGTTRSGSLERSGRRVEECKEVQDSHVGAVSGARGRIMPSFSGSYRQQCT